MRFGIHIIKKRIDPVIGKLDPKTTHQNTTPTATSTTKADRIWIYIDDAASWSVGMGTTRPHHRAQVGLGHRPRSQLRPVWLRHQHESQEISVRSDWDVDTSNHTANTYRRLEIKKRKEKLRKKSALLEAATAEASILVGTARQCLPRGRDARRRLQEGRSRDARRGLEEGREINGEFLRHYIQFATLEIRSACDLSVKFR